MATLVISGGVRENALTGAASATNFTSITLQNTNANPKLWTFPTGVRGLPEALQITEFTFERFVRQVFKDDLAPISVHLFDRLPLTTRGGSIADGVAHNDSAELVKFTYDVLDGRDETTESQSFWGVFQLQNVQRVGRRESGSIIAYRCDVLRFANSTTYYANPDATF